MIKTVPIVFDNLDAGDLGKIIFSGMQEAQAVPVIHEEAIRTACNSVELCCCCCCFLFGDSLMLLRLVSNSLLSRGKPRTSGPPVSTSPVLRFPVFCLFVLC